MALWGERTGDGDASSSGAAEDEGVTIGKQLNSLSPMQLGFCYRLGLGFREALVAMVLYFGMTGFRFMLAF